MIRYAVKRIAGAVPTLFILITLTFFLLRLAPGGPFDSDQVWPPEIQANILHRYELDQPIVLQFTHWLRDFLKGDLRESFQYLGRPVNEIISETLPVSIILGGGALLLTVILGLPLGCWAAWRRDKWPDRVILFFAVSGISLPVYLIASLLILVFSLWLQWLPPALWEGPSTLVLPILALAWRPTAMLVSLTRTTVLETLHSDYIRTAYGKGLPDSVILFKHALKNSLIPILTILGPITANLITGSFLVEVIFQVPGMGKYFVQAVLNRDYPLVMGVTVVYGVILILSNLLVDLLYGWADPRIQIEGEST